MGVEILTPTVIDKVPEGFTTDQSIIDSILGTTGYEDLNSERQEIEKDAGVYQPIDGGHPNVIPAEQNQPKDLSGNIQKANTQNDFAENSKIEQPTNGQSQPDPFADILQPTQTPEIQQSTPQITTFTEEQFSQKLAEEVAVLEEKWKEVAEQIKKFNENPYEFLSEKAPHLVQKFDKIGYIREQLEKEFGKEFQVLTTEMAIPGTESNAYLLRQMELQKEAEGFVQKATSVTDTQKAAREQEIQNYKQEIMKRYKFENEADFDKQVWQELQELNPKDVWSRLAEHKLLLQRIKNGKEGITTPAKTGFETPGVNQTQEVNRNSGDDSWKALFPQEAFKKAENRIF